MLMKQRQNGPSKWSREVVPPKWSLKMVTRNGPPKCFPKIVPQNGSLSLVPKNDPPQWFPTKVSRNDPPKWSSKMPPPEWPPHSSDLADQRKTIFSKHIQTHRAIFLSCCSVSLPATYLEAGIIAQVIRPTTWTAHPTGVVQHHKPLHPPGVRPCEFISGGVTPLK